MPRHIDPELEGRVLEAARKLWHKGGQKALSMRAVARLAGTNTPALYRRFRHREDILKALVEAYQMEVFQIVEPCESLREFAESTLDYALGKPREYELLMSGLGSRVTEGRPVFNLFRRRCAEWLGGTPDDHVLLALSLTALMHGTVTLLLAGNLFAGSTAEMKGSFLQAVDVLVANEKALRPGRAKGKSGK